MKRTLLLIAVFVASLASFAMSTSKIRQHARFLSDRMAYELDLTPYQYDDVYEINYDFIYTVNRIMDDAVYGYTDAIDRYYTYLDYRNDDLRYVLNANQYRRFMMADYFYRPIYSTGRNWSFRIYTIYSNHNFFYYDRPTSYGYYSGAHGRNHYSSGYYMNRNYGYGHDRYQPSNIRGGVDFNGHRRNDFGANLVTRAQGNGGQGHGHGNGYSVGTRPNDYNNANQNNRTQDPRYRDNSGNQNSPQINNRNQNNNQGGTYNNNQNNRDNRNGSHGNQQYNDRNRGDQNNANRPNSSERSNSRSERQESTTRTATPTTSGGHGHGNSTRGSR